jgi:ElaB/YqjD/DUF883 family membrane-anchored ribosome-binding protein
VAEERNQVVNPGTSPLAPDLPVLTPLHAREIDDVDVPATVETTGLGTGPVTAPGSDDPEAIRERIERTREDMSQTINELQQRLSPQHLAQQARDSMREAAVGRVHEFVGAAGETATDVARRAQVAAAPVIDQVREHPLPIALAGAGAGLAWWLARRSTSRRSWSEIDMDQWDDDMTGTRDYASLDLRGNEQGRTERGADGGWLRQVMDSPLPASLAAAGIGYLIWSRRASLSGHGADVDRGFDDDDLDDGPSATARVSDAARDLRRQAGEKAGELGEQVGDTVRSVQARAGEMSRQVSRRLQSAGTQTSSQFERWMQDNPLAVGVAAMAAGACVGLSVPTTHTENQVLGASRDALMDRASDSASQLKAQVRDKVQAVAKDISGAMAEAPAPGV